MIAPKYTINIPKIRSHGSKINCFEMIPIPENILKEIDETIRKYNKAALEREDVLVKQIWYNDGDFEEKGDYLFFITETKFSENLGESLTNLEFKISRENPNFSLSFLTWPCGVSNSSNYGFIEKVFEYE